MTTLTLAVPSYNSAAYLHRCLDSLMPLEDDLEVIVVNDGSSDDTSAIAHRYAEAHPGQVRVVDVVRVHAPAERVVVPPQRHVVPRVGEDLGEGRAPGPAADDGGAGHRPGTGG